MTHFNIDHRTDLADRIFVEIDRLFDVCIIRTENGLEIRIYPRTEGQLWNEPFDIFTVDHSEILEVESEMEVEKTTTPNDG